MLAYPKHDKRVRGAFRSKADNPEGDIRPEQVAATSTGWLRPDAIYTADTGMSAVGLTMLLGDLITAVSYDLPVTFVVFNNRRLGMVKLELELTGLAEFGTQLDNPDLSADGRSVGMHGVRVEDPDDVEKVIRQALDHTGPALVDEVTESK